ncbi:SDR family NAD(P)-dependent oxidoreductase [Erwinia phyllosphaerae]|uniref:SDR family NAD(P)-dependent oxidoreductase n=1 Tax=Erwinia phyllosphaerae TaxID=2853256 RepID=UPI001FF00023|nr:SDR family oxidoreductase [Erwinia phyllosphaerae]MBV4368745.1 SDR family oxidoreductase [Erwinia phyllosphaerae]
MSHKIAVITGGSRGLGRNGALKLAEKGVDVILTWRGKEPEALETVKEIEALGARGVALQLNVSDSQAFPAFVDEVKKQLKAVWQRDSFDYLVNNAGTALHEPFISTTEAQFDELVNVHFKGPFFLTQLLLPLMVNGGSILNISSGLTRFSQPGSGAYAAMKGAMEVLTRYQAKELAARGIRVNILAPGAIETDFSDGRVRDNPQVNAFISSVTALGRPGVPDDIGKAIAMLLSEESGWITGQRIEASGGMFL